MSQMFKSYPRNDEQYPVTKSRNLGWKDFPVKLKGTPDEALLEYLRDHNISYDSLLHVPNVYATDVGICFMVVNKDRKIAYTLRYTKPRADMSRFFNPSGVNLGDFIWWTDNPGNTRDLVIVEGVMDSVRVYNAGYSAISILGSNLTEARAELIRIAIAKYPRRRVLYIPDNDGPGVAALAKFVRHRLYIPWSLLPLGVKDVSELLDFELTDLLHGSFDLLYRGSTK